MMKENDILDLDIEDISPEGRGLAKANGKTIFVRDALPGEKVKARVLTVGKNIVSAKMEKVVQASPDRVDSEIAKWAHDGYARLANMKYDKQLAFKKHRIEKLLKQEGLSDIKVEDTIASPKQTGYRNELDLPVRNVNGQLELGFYEPRTDHFVPLDSFITADEEIAKVMLGVRNVLREQKIPAYDPATNKGFIRDISVRRSESNNGMIVTLVTREKDRANIPEVMGLITEKLHNINGIVLNFNPHRTSSTFGARNIPLWGNDYITDELNGVEYKISPRSFFQSNSLQLKALVDTAVKLADLKDTDDVIDAYCGVGTIGLNVAKKVHSVRGVEKAKIAIEDAKENIAANKINNARYYSGSVEQIMARWAKQKASADVIFADPPKRGLSKGFIYAAVKLNPRKIVYLSANPDTLVRDLKLFAHRGYHCSTIVPVDTLPQMPDMKCVCVLTK